jgi:hypothetical protein
MGGQLATWAGAIADIEFMAKKAENPPFGLWGATFRLKPLRFLRRRKKSKHKETN